MIRLNDKYKLLIHKNLFILYFLDRLNNYNFKLKDFNLN